MPTRHQNTEKSSVTSGADSGAKSNSQKAEGDSGQRIQERRPNAEDDNLRRRPRSRSRDRDNYDDRRDRRDRDRRRYRR